MNLIATAANALRRTARSLMPPVPNSALAPQVNTAAPAAPATPPAPGYGQQPGQPPGRDYGFEAYLSAMMNNAQRGSTLMSAPGSHIKTNVPTFDGLSEGQFYEKHRALYADPNFDKTQWLARANGQDVAANGTGNRSLAAPRGPWQPTSSLSPDYNMGKLPASRARSLVAPPSITLGVDPTWQSRSSMAGRTVSDDGKTVNLTTSGAQVKTNDDGSRSLISPFGTGSVTFGPRTGPASFTDPVTGQKGSLAEVTQGRALTPPAPPAEKAPTSVASSPAPASKNDSEDS